MKRAFALKTDPRHLYLYAINGDVQAGNVLIEHEHNLLSFLRTKSVPSVLESVLVTDNLSGKRVLKVSHITHVCVLKPHHTNSVDSLLRDLALKPWTRAWRKDLAEQMRAIADALRSLNALVDDLQFMVVPPSGESCNGKLILFDPFRINIIHSDPQEVRQVPFSTNAATKNGFARMQAHWNLQDLCLRNTADRIEGGGIGGDRQARVARQADPKLTKAELGRFKRTREELCND